ncbi:hypothetical protein acdb102_43720 [Acidothermaceae bacterium B102]|nr:hypothetical protein acdb102_43720 [Acidothermaceae bacterium B102]
MTTPHIALVVPTRNRPQLAAQAVRSVLGQLGDATACQLLVSDNSTEPASIAQLARLLASSPDATVIRPPTPLPMVGHWQFALDAALADPAVTHVGFLTDRMVMRPGELGRLSLICAALPDRVITFDTDAVLDADTDVRVHLNPWSGDVRQVASRTLLDAAAHGRPSATLPRMLNSLAPRAVLDQVAQRYGTVFASIAPDYCFAYRCLTVVDSVARYERSAYVHHASAMSNGANQARGTVSDDSRRFTAELVGPLNAHAPVPELQGVLNAIMNEYCFVRADGNEATMPAVDQADYLAAIDRDLDSLVDEVLQRDQRALLTRLGHQPVPFDVWRRAERARVARKADWRAARRIVARLAGFPASRTLWERARVAPPSAEWFVWSDAARALEFAVDIGRRREASDSPDTRLLGWHDVRG